MDILFLLVPLSVVLVFAIMAVFAWALRSGQFDDVEREALRILQDDHLQQPDVLLPVDEGRSQPVRVDTDQATR
ncbi:MAG: hypothetical protein RL722_2469 [Pseudomonadota bacterium]|jgi:cbb3-type cytochrome oxidase maturation protein